MNLLNSISMLLILAALIWSLVVFLRLRDRSAKLAAVEQELRQQHEQSDVQMQRELRFARTVFEEISDSVLVLSGGYDLENLRIMAANPACVKLNEFPLEEILNAQLGLLLDFHGAEYLVQSLQEQLAQRRSFSIDLPSRKKNGEQFTSQFRLNPVYGSNSEIANWVVFQHDTTEKRKMEDRLKQTERLASLGTLAAGMAHEINNPLGSIMIAAQYAHELSRKGDQTDIVGKAFDDIVVEARRISNIINNVLKFAREEHSEKVLVSVNDLAKNAQTLTRSFADRHGAALELSLGEQIPSIKANPTQIEQVLVNLIRNAIEVRDNTRIRISTRAKGGAVEVCVEDNGLGLSEEERQRVFDPFYTSKRTTGGTGLGLSVVHGLVSEHRGTIKVESRKGLGCTFIITLPTASGPANRQI